jgi:hypothetical protein
MATSSPPDLLNFRSRFMTETGLTDPVEVGIVGDQAHEERGGYHISGNGINDAGRFSTDYSTKRTRDHFLPNPYASAVDLGDDWPRGGRDAWIRFGNNVLWDIMHTNLMPSIRAINVSTNGTNKKRYDRANAGDGLIDSTDTVTIHTHLEFWRDTEGTAQRATDLNRLIAHVKVARDGISMEEALGNPPPSPQQLIGDSDVIFTVTGVPAGTLDLTGTAIPENGQCLATPGGAFNLTGTEFFSLPASAQAVRITMPWTRFSKLCYGMTQVAQINPQIIVDAVVNAVHALNVDLTPEDLTAIANAAAGAVQASTVTALQSAPGQAALVQAANTAEDS